MWQQKGLWLLETTEHCWVVLPPRIHQPHLACLSSLDTSWSNPQAVRKGIRFVSADENSNLLGQLHACANGLQLQSCDMSDLTTHTYPSCVDKCTQHLECEITKFLPKSTLQKCPSLPGSKCTQYLECEITKFLLKSTLQKCPSPPGSILWNFFEE